MISIVVAFAILWVAMYLSIQVVNFVFVVFNLASKSDVTELGKTENRSWLERIIESSLEYLQWTNFSTNQISSVHACEIETGAVYTEAIANAEGLEEGIAAVESVGEHMINAIRIV